MIKYDDFSFENKDYPHKKLSYILTFPRNYDRNEKLPLIVFLHGMGERGDDVNIVKVHGIPKYFTSDEEYDGVRAITLSPQCPIDTVWTNITEQIFTLVEYIAGEYNVDRKKISITGLSMGGHGTWEMGIQYNDYFSCIAPICGGGTEYRAKNLVNMPVWAFHGSCDETVPISRSQTMIEAIKNAGGNPKFTVFEGVGHNSWESAYEKTDLIKWLVAQTK